MDMYLSLLIFAGIMWTPVLIIALIQMLRLMQSGLSARAGISAPYMVPYRLIDELPDADPNPGMAIMHM